MIESYIFRIIVMIVMDYIKNQDQLNVYSVVLDLSRMDPLELRL